MTNRKAPSKGWQQIGTLLVDSGCITIGDPCRLVDLEYAEMSPGNDLHQQIEKPHGDPPDGTTLPVAVTMRSGWGDGYYPVMALINKGTVEAVMIDFSTTHLLTR
jgi:hypothetical protein